MREHLGALKLDGGERGSAHLLELREVSMAENVVKIGGGTWRHRIQQNPLVLSIGYYTGQLLLWLRSLSAYSGLG